MKTATTTTTRAAERMTRAHEMTRETLAKYPAADYRATFAAALRIAWKEIPAPAAVTPRAAWDALTDAEKVERLERMVWHELRAHAGGTNARGETRPSPFDFIAYRANGAHLSDEETRDNAAAVVSESFIMLESYMLDQADPAEQLPRTIHRAAHHAAVKLSRRAARALKTRTTTTEDGEKTREDYFVLNAAPTAEPIAPNPETAAILADTLAAVCADDIDRAIVSGRAYGYAQKEIAARAGVDPATISRRLRAIRDRYEAIDTEAAAADLARVLSRLDGEGGALDLSAQLYNMLACAC